MIVDVFKGVYGVVVSVFEVMKWYAVIEDIDIQFSELVDPFLFVNRKKKQKKRKVEIIEIDSDEGSCVSVVNLFVPLQNTNLGMVRNGRLWRIVDNFEDGFIDENDNCRDFMVV